MATSGQERWEEIRRLFKAAMEIPSEARAAFLRTECGADQTLFDDVAGLIAAGGGDTMISAIVDEAAMEAVQASEIPGVSQRIGNYRLVRLVGTGGMGNVYLAERDDDRFEHRVAIKLLHSGRTDETLLRRFESERQMLANLHHPNIARLLDGGETSDGVPYLVMEYVEGVSIDVYCNQERLTVPERLALFQKICAAVDYAHRNLVVHRDIKPSNILVNDLGEPKLLDFGIGKFLDGASGDPGAPPTVDAKVAMTPEYASPEQIRREPVSTATDVYSLGVLLYRMLCGRMPYRSSAGPLVLSTAILEAEPSAPSEMLTIEDDTEPDSDTALEISSQRATSVAKLKSDLSGDLDNIVLMTLRKEPARRYLSAMALSLDIDHFLNHRPVSARSDSVVYRVRKFVRRHRVGAAISVAATVLLLGSAAQLVEQQRQVAISAEQSEQIAGFLGELFASASTTRSQGSEITANDLLAAGVEEIEKLTGQPEVQARLLDIMGSSYVWIGDFDRGSLLLEKSLRIREDQLERDPASIGYTLKELAQGRKESRRLEESANLLRRSLELLHEAHGENHSSIAYTMGRLGDVLRLLIRPDDARIILEEAVAMKVLLGESDDLATIDLRGLLAITLDQLGHYDEAASISEQVVETTRILEGPRHPNTAIRIANLGLTYGRVGRYDKSFENIEESYHLIREIWSSNPNQLEWATSIYAGSLRELGRFAESGEAFAVSREISLQHYGENDLGYARSLHQLGHWHYLQAQYGQAVARYQQALLIAVDLGADPGVEIGRIRSRLAQVWNAMGDHSAAQIIARRALAAPEALKRWTEISLQVELAQSLSLGGEFDEASALFEEAVRRRAEFVGESNVGMLDTLQAASRHNRRAGLVQQAVSLAGQAHEIGQAITPPGNWMAALASAEYAHALVAAGELDAAWPLAQEAHEDLSRIFGLDDPRVAELSRMLDGFAR